MNKVTRIIIEVIFQVLALPLKIVLALYWVALAIQYKLKGFGGIKQYWDKTNMLFYENLNKEINWIKTGSC